MIEEKQFDIEELGYPKNALELYQIDYLFFESIPFDLKKDVLENGRIEYNKKFKSFIIFIYHYFKIKYKQSNR